MMALRPASAMAGSVLPARRASRIGGPAAPVLRRTLCARPRSAPPLLQRPVAASATPTDAASAAALGAYARGLPSAKQQQQQAPSEATTTTTASSSFFRPPTATLTRIFLTGTSPGGALRSALTGGGSGARGAGRPATGPLSLLLVLMALVAAALAAVRKAVVRRVRGCGSCRGFGVTRCRLCQGSGRVDWTAKLSHYDVCPLCMNRRFVSCQDCGGAHGARPLFAHLTRRSGGELFEGVPRPAAEEEAEQQSQQGQPQPGGYGGALALAGAVAGGVPAAGASTSSAPAVPLVSQQGTRGPVLAGFAAALGSLASSDDEDEALARQPTGAASSRKRAQKIRDVAGGLAAFSVPADAAAPARIGSAMMD